MHPTGDDSEANPTAVPGEALEATPPDIASFDEMNLVELPFALLTRDTRGIYEIPLSSDGESRLMCAKSSVYGLPNSLAPHVVLGLMSLWKTEFGGKTQTMTVSLRDLVERYMYPDRFKSYDANSELLKAAERQINCIANSRIHTNRWWNNELKNRQQANIAIISDVTVVEAGSKGRPRTLQVTWGREFFHSMLNRYTKPLDARLVQRLDKPIDLQLYRLLDRQLKDKPSQSYASITDFAQFKLGMQGHRIAAGGRTASAYVAAKLTEAVRRLDHERFSVRMTIDRTTVPFGVTFERLAVATPQQAHEVCDDDAAGDLVREFRRAAHGPSPEEKRSRISERDRAIAQEWLETYGKEKATWMVRHALRLQRERRAPNVMLFRGLAMYESAAAGAYERSVTRHELAAEQQESDALAKAWCVYQTNIVKSYDSQATTAEATALEASEHEKLQREKSSSPPYILAALLRARVHEAKLAAMHAMAEGEFREHRSLQSFRDAVLAKHGVDLLAEGDDSPSESVDHGSERAA